MAFLAPLAALLGIEVDSLIIKLKRSAGIYAALALLALICLVFLLVAAHAALSYAIGPVWAALALAGVALLAAVILWFWAQAAERARQRKIVEKRKSTDTTALLTTAAITALPMLIRNPAMRMAAVPVGLLAGYLFLNQRQQSNEEKAKREGV
jgi:cobalamin synthase